MSEAHPRPRTDSLVTPKVDDSVATWLGAAYPRQTDGQLSTLQNALHQAAGPVSCLWASLESDPSVQTGSVPATDIIPEVKNVIQRTLVLLGHANASLSKMRRNWLIESKDKFLAKSCRDDELPETGNLLFGETFSAKTVEKVKSGNALADASRLLSRAQPRREPRFQSTQQSRPFRRDTGTFSARPPFRRGGSSAFRGHRSGAPYQTNRTWRPQQSSAQQWKHSPAYRTARRDGTQGQSFSIVVV